MTEYSYEETNFTNTGSPININLETLHEEIENSSISSASLQYINHDSGNVIFVFDGPLSTGSPSDKNTLDGIVANHDGSEPTPTPPSSPDDGEPWFDSVSNMWYQYDANKDKWLSINKTRFTFSRETYKDFSSGTISTASIKSREAGYKITFKSTIVSLNARITSGDQTKEFYILKNNSTKLLLFSLTDGEYNNTNLDIDINQYDLLSCISLGKETVENPIIEIELAYRY